jgi:hypothetical protein
MQFIETSAKFGTNVDDMILILATEIKNRFENKNIKSIGPKSSILYTGMYIDSKKMII